MKKSKMNNSNMKTTNKRSQQVTNKKQNNNVTDCKSVTDSKDNIGFEAEDHSFQYDEDSNHSFELRDCK